VIGSWLRSALRRVTDAVIDAAAPPIPTVLEDDPPKVVDPCIALYPMLFVDLYWRDLLGRPNIPRLLSASWGPDVGGAWRPYHGAILKATEGTRYATDAIAWFARTWRAVGSSERYQGGDFVRGAYHYLRFLQGGKAQAEAYLRTVNRAGGWRGYDVLPIVDVEFGGVKSSNRDASRQQVIDCASSWVATVRAETGRDVILYGGSALAELRIRDRFGCRWLWPAAYSSALKPREATAIGWTLDDVIAWQYTDGKTATAVTTKGTHLPREVPGFGAVDCSVFLAGRTIPDFINAMCGELR
jgi:hypothetical protein